jgi:hypothetical protein
MTNGERRLLKAWLILTILAAIPFFLGWLLILLIFTGIGIPVVFLLEAAPTIWLYATTILLVYALLRWAARGTRLSRALLAGVAVAVAVAAGVAVPTLANREIGRRVAAILEGDMGAEPLLKPVGSVAILIDAGLGPTDGKCSDECQRILFSGFAGSVFQASLDALPPPGRRKSPIMRHSIVPMELGCDNAMLIATYASEAEWNGPPPPPFLWEKLDDLAANGKCFRSDRSSDARADLYLVNDWNHDPRAGSAKVLFKPTLLPLEPFRRREVLVRRGERLVPLMRRTQLHYARLAVPLRVSPPFEFDTYEPGHWTYQRAVEVGTWPRYDGMMGHWLRNDLRILGLGKRREPDIVVEAHRAGHQAGR